MIARALALAGGELVEMLGGPLGQAARAVKPMSQRERMELIAKLRAPVPNLRAVHPSWIEHALASLPPRARRAVAAGGGDPTDVWLARWACAEIPPLPDLRGGPVRSLADLVAHDALEPWLRAVGTAQLQYATSLAQPGAPRRPELGGGRAVIARCKGGDVLAIGARAIAPHVDPFAARQLAVRLPRATGLAVLAELHAHAADPIADAPTWAALAAT